MSKPIFELSIVRKDGENQTFTDYKGDEVSKKYRKIGCVFPSRLEGKGGGSIVFEKEFDIASLASGDFWINLDEPYGAKSSKPAAKAATTVKRKAPAKTADDGDDLP